MAVIVLVVFGFLLLAFVMLFRKRHIKGFEQLMRNNHNVAPLFKEQAARTKYLNLHAALKHQPDALQHLAQLHTTFANKQINIDAYHNALDELAQIPPAN